MPFLAWKDDIFDFLGQKDAAGCFKMQFGARKSTEHIQNNPKLTGLVKISLPHQGGAQNSDPLPPF